jgi:hypothetical protein
MRLAEYMLTMVVPDIGKEVERGDPAFFLCRCRFQILRADVCRWGWLSIHADHDGARHRGGGGEGGASFFLMRLSLFRSYELMHAGEAGWVHADHGGAGHRGGGGEGGTSFFRRQLEPGLVQYKTIDNLGRLGLNENAFLHFANFYEIANLFCTLLAVPRSSSTRCWIRSRAAEINHPRNAAYNLFPAISLSLKR